MALSDEHKRPKAASARSLRHLTAVQNMGTLRNAILFMSEPPDHSHPDSGGRRAQDEERRGTWNLYDIGREKDKRKGQGQEKRARARERKW